jgi:Tfp pilus assembly PilM family ATPase
VAIQLKLPHKAITEIVAIDLDPSETRCVKIKKNSSNFAITAAQFMEPVDIASNQLPARIILPKPLIARHVAITFSADAAIVKLLNLPGKIDSSFENQLNEHIGVPEGMEFRIGYKVIGHSRGETRVLIVAIPESVAAAALQCFPAGFPVPRSLELSGLSALTAFQKYLAIKDINEAVGVIEHGASSSFFAFFSKKEPTLIRKFEFGLCDIYEKVEQSLSVDRETAIGIVSDSSFDISQIVKEVSEQFIKQVVISKHFVERRENCTVKTFFAPAGTGISRNVIDELKVATSSDIKTWSAFETIDISNSLDLTELKPVLWKFNSVIGTGMGFLSESQNI